MKRLFPLLVFLASLWAQSGTADAFLGLGSSPRAMALGNAIVAMNNNPSGIFVNPAASGFSNQRSINLMGVNAFGMADYFTLGGSFSVSGMRWTVQSAMLSITGIPEHPDLRSITSLEARRDSIRAWTAAGYTTFGDLESAVVINGSRSYTKTVDLGWQVNTFQVKIPIGFSVRILNKRLGNLTGSGIGADMGTMITIPLNEISLLDRAGNLTLGLSVLNLAGTRLFWNSKKVDLIPMEFVSGFTYEQPLWKDKVSLRLLGQKTSLYSGEFRWGGELTIGKRLMLRIGRDQVDLQGGLGLVLPIHDHSISVDYSFTTHDLGSVHRLGATMNF